LSIALARPALGQIPDKYENLQVLPKTTTRQELGPIMRELAGALGVRCDHCHVELENPRGMDFASDKKQEKLVARDMMRMVAKINGNFLASMKLPGDKRVKVECATCHRGLAVPERIERVLSDAIAGGGVGAAEARYLELKQKYYGRSAYDFGAPPLTTVAEELAAAGKLDDAVAVGAFAVEQWPAEVWPRLVVANLHAQRGEKDKAIAEFQKVLELDPGNQRATRMLEKLKAAQ
jgi:tetratricopeptide (TPR) repeat protein